MSINYYYQITHSSFTYFLLSLLYALLLVNSAMFLKNNVSTGLIYVLGANLALNTAYSLLTLFNSTSLIDVFTAVLLIILITTAVAKDKASYLSTYTPVAMITGVFVGLAIGVEYPLRYSILGILDISLSQLVIEEAKRETLLARTITAFVLYTSPVYFTSILTFLYNLVLFILKNLMVSEKSHLITSLDIAFKPLIYGVKP